MFSVTEIKLALLLILLMLACTVAISAKFLRLPYSVSLVLAGLVIGQLKILPPIELSYDLVLFICLPALIFEAAWNLNSKDLLKQLRPVLILAILGVFITLFTSIIILNKIALVNLSIAIMFGAIIAATDPISVLAVFKQLGIDKKIVIILEGESLFNDGVAVVVFGFANSFVLSNLSFNINPVNIIIKFLLVIMGGALIGVIIGTVAGKFKLFFKNHLLAITISGVVAYGSFLVGDLFHASSVIAAIMASLVFTNTKNKNNMGASARLALNGFWEYAAFMVNSLVFLLIGLQMNLQLLFQEYKLISLGIIAILLARFILIYGLSFIYQNQDHKLNLNEKHIVFLGALRGGLSMALALSLPAQIPHRNQIIVLTYGVVLFTLIVPGLSIEYVVKKLKLIPQYFGELLIYEKLKTALILEQNALNGLKDIFQKGEIELTLYDEMQNQLKLKITGLLSQIQELHLNNELIRSTQNKMIQQKLYEIRKDNLLQEIHLNVISNDVANELLTELDESIEE